MQSKILEKKKKITKNGIEIVDLTTRSMSYSTNGDVIDAFYVGDDMEMRIDLISYAAYGNDDNFDSILKFNGISNPYSIESTMLLQIPDLNFMYSSMDSPANVDEVESVRNQYIDTNKKSDIDPNKIIYDDELKELRKSISGGLFSKYNLPPNMSEPGEYEAKTTNDGDIILGGYVTSKNNNK